VSSLTDTQAGALASERYIAVKLHFSTDGYDFFKYNGRVRSGRINSRDAGRLARIEKKYRGQELTDYLVANVAAGKTWVGDFSEKTYLEWRRRVESLRYHLRDQVGIIARECTGDPRRMWEPGESSYPPVLRLHMGRRLSLETMAATDMVLRYAGSWKKAYSSDVVVPDYARLIRKYVPFLAQRIERGAVEELMIDALRECARDR